MFIFHYTNYEHIKLVLKKEMVSKSSTDFKPTPPMTRSTTTPDSKLLALECTIRSKRKNNVVDNPQNKVKKRLATYPLGCVWQSLILTSLAYAP